VVVGFLAAILLTVIVFGVLTMAKLADVNDAITTQTAAIVALAARIPTPGAATEADLDTVKAGIDANTASINQLVPPVTTTP
jgi:hypothetical protein